MELAQSHGVTLAQLAVAWVLERDEISSAIIGATSLEQLEENLKAKDVELDGKTMAKIEVILDNKTGSK
jgi:aryl-alcohol dehydrogenase-like predicted oxidoreductase